VNIKAYISFSFLFYNHLKGGEEAGIIALLLSLYN